MKIKIKSIIIFCLILVFGVFIISNAENTQVEGEKSSNNIEEETFKVEVEYKYNSNNNTVTAIIKSNRELKNTKPTWKLSKDKLSYSKEFGFNSKYNTLVQDILGNEITVEIEITRNRLQSTRNYNVL